MSALLCAMSMPAVAQVQTADPVFYGYQGDMNGDFPRGLFAFTAEGTKTDMLWRDQLAYNPDGSLSTIDMLGGWVRNGMLCGYESYYPVPSLDYYKYVERDLLTGDVKLVKAVDSTGDSWNNIFLYAAYCPVDDRVYGYGFNKSRTKFVFKSAPATDLDQAVIIKVCDSYQEMCRSICFNPEQGILVGLNGSYNLVQIDVNTGAQTPLYKPTLNPAPDYDIASGLIWIPSRQAYAWNFYTVEADYNVSTFKLIDAANGTTRDLRNFPAGYNFTYFVAQNNDPVAATGAPEMCSGLAAHFAGTAQTGNFTFTLPAKLIDGSAINGNVDYQVYVDNQPTDSGSAAAGTSVTTGNINLSDGTHYVRVVPQVNGVKGLSELIAAFIGQDTPLAPVNVTLTETNLTWDPVTKGIHGDVLQNVTYKIYVGGRLVEETSSTSVAMEDIIDANSTLAAYQAEVVAECEGKISKGTLSNTLIVGQAYSVPFTIEPTETQFSVCTVEDTDNNNVKWSYYTRDYDNQPVLLSGYEKNTDSEDWLFLPRFKAQTNKIYTFSFNVNIADSSLPYGKVEAWLGTEASSSAMKVNIIPSIAISDYSVIKLSGSFMIPEELASAGEYYIGLGVKSEEGRLAPLELETLKVVETSDNMAGPDAVSALEVKNIPDKPLQTEISFVLPDRTLAGDPIPATHIVSAKITTSSGQSKSMSGAPGEKLSAKMELGQGEFLVTVTPSVGDVTGMSANGVVRLGFGYPGVVRNLRAEYSESNTGLTLRWDAPATDMDGTPSEDDMFDYNVYTYDQSEGAYVLQVTVPYPLTYATMQMSNILSLTNIDVRISAVNAVGESPETAAIVCQVGKPHSLPMEDDFDGDALKYEPITYFKSDGYENANISWTTPEKLNAPDQMKTGDIGDVIAGVPTVAGAKSRFIFPKFTTEGIDGVDCHFLLWTGEDAAEINVGATAFPMDSEKIIYEVPAGDGYKDVIVGLPSDMVNNPWVSVALNIVYPNLSSRFILAAYCFERGFDSVDGVSETLFGTITGGEGMVRIFGYMGQTAHIYTLDGRQVKIEKLADTNNVIDLEPGLYIVKVADRTAKVVVR